MRLDQSILGKLRLSAEANPKYAYTLVYPDNQRKDVILETYEILGDEILAVRTKDGRAEWLRITSIRSDTGEVFVEPLELEIIVGVAD
jgi:hypothetical protein